MIKETLDRETVRSVLELVSADLTSLALASGSRRRFDGDVPQDFGDVEPQEFEAAREAIDAAREREQAESSGQIGFDAEEKAGVGRRGEGSASMDEVVFLSRDPDICALQSAMDEYFAEVAQDRVITEALPDAKTLGSARRDADDEDGGKSSSPVMVTDRRIHAPANRRLLDQFSVTDIRWISCLYAVARRQAAHRHAFNTTPAVRDIAADARLVIVGDWATGLPRALCVAKQMGEALRPGIQSGRDQHAIHLGDTYYSGWPKEYERRFLPHWPVSTSEAQHVRSWSLNANHDMYSGGHGYYDTLLADERFAEQAGCSYFALQSPHWRILGIDTGWIEGDLHEPQADWLRQQCEQASELRQRVLLLSHHPLVSAYESQGDTLRNRLAHLLDRRLIHAWIWGHEHRCMVYAPNNGLSYAACVGHGGVPVYMSHRDNGEWPAPAIYEDRRYIRRGLERWAYMGFCVVDLLGEHLRVRYLDEHGECIRIDEI